MDRLHVELFNQEHEMNDLELQIVKETNKLELIRDRFSKLVRHVTRYRTIYISIFIGLLLLSTILLVAVLLRVNN